MEFTEEQWHGLKQHADERGIQFLSSPFSIEAVDLLTRVGVAAWKVASGEVSNTPMLERMLATGLPMLLSSGMSPLHELDAAVALVQHQEVPLTVLQCTSAYPCPPEKWPEPTALFPRPLWLSRGAVRPLGHHLRWPGC